MKNLLKSFAHLFGCEVMSRRTYQKLQQAAGGGTGRREFMPLDSAGASRFLYYDNLFRQVLDVPGDVVECGVGNARSLINLIHLVRLYDTEKNVWGFDSFEGFPEPSDEDRPEQSEGIRKGSYRVGLSLVNDRLKTYIGDEMFLRRRVTLVPGFFEETLNRPIRIERIALLNLDVDLYESYKLCLEKLYPRLSRGGIITFDEYIRESGKYPGGRKAIDEFFEGRPVEFQKDPYYGKFYAVKREDASVGTD